MATLTDALNLTGNLSAGSSGTLVRRYAALVLIVGFGCLTIFCLPWLLPTTRPVHSISYYLGFNNQVAVLGALGTVLLLAAFLIANPQIAWARGSESALDASLESEAFAGDVQQPDGANLALRRLLLVVAALFGIVMLFFYLSLPQNYWIDTGYFMPRIDLLLLGRLPYRDFELIYGPLCVYLPAALVQLSGYRLGSNDAYIATTIAFTVLGLGLTAYILSAFGISSANKCRIFGLMALGSFNLLLGMNYTLLRFALPYASLIFLHMQAERFSPVSKLVRFVVLLSMGTAITAAGFSLSPELGITSCLGLLVYSVALERDKNDAGGLLPVCLGVVLGSTLLLELPGYFAGLRAFSNGGYAFPVYPAANMVFYLTSLFATVPCLIAYGWRHRNRSGALCIAWSALALAYASPCLGMCDFFHVYFNGFGVFLISFVLIAQSKKIFQNYGRLFFAVFVIGLQLTLALFYQDDFGFMAKIRSRGEHRMRRDVLATSSGLDDPNIQQVMVSLRQEVGPDAKIALPDVTNEAWELALERANLYQPDYYLEPWCNIFTVNQLHSKMRDILKSEWLIAEKARVEQEQPPQENFEAAFDSELSRKLLLSVHHKMLRPPLYFEYQLTHLIHQDYVIRQQIGYYSLLQRRNPLPMAP